MTPDLVAGRADVYGNCTVDLGGVFARPSYAYRRVDARTIVREDLIGFEWWHSCTENSSWAEVIYPTVAVPCPICGHAAPDTIHVEATIATQTFKIDPPDLPFRVGEA